MKERDKTKLQEIVASAVGIEDRRDEMLRRLISYIDRFRTKEKKIAILGTATDSRREVPFEHEISKGGEWEIWGLSERPEDVPVWSRWFELHNLERKRTKSPGYWAQLKNMTKPLYVAHAHPELPKALIFPKDEITQYWGTYFTNTVSWLIAFAYMEGATTLGIWGVDMATNTEYGGQRPSCEYYIGRVEGEGCRVIIPPESDLLKTRRLYGFDDAGDRMAAKVQVRNEELRERQAMTNRQHEGTSKQAHMIMGGMKELQLLIQADGDLNKELLGSRLQELQAEAEEAIHAERQLLQAAAAVRGAIENQKWVAQGL